MKDEIGQWSSNDELKPNESVRASHENLTEAVRRERLLNQQLINATSKNV